MHAIVVSLLLATFLACAAPPAAPLQDAKPAAPTKSGATAPFDHSAFDALLKKHVKGDRVDYAALKAGRAELDGYCDRLAKLPKAALDAMERNDQIAFWVNAYNAFTLKTILDHYPIQPSATPNAHPRNSIRQIDGAWTDKHAVASQQVSLDDIENKILRPTFKDPRVHTAINCASRGCPPLRAEAFTGARLDQQLDDNVAKFLADPARTVYAEKKGKVVVSKIFDWFKEDFGGDDGVVKFLRAHAPAAQRQFLESATSKSLDYLDYDWSLNDL
jgi:hypothetical protein